MKGDKLYSIKWYRNGHEFYRYLPTDNPKTTVFNGDGITDGGDLGLFLSVWGRCP